MQYEERQTIIIAGHSHTLVLAPWSNGQDSFELFALSDPEFSFLSGWPRREEYWDYLISSSSGRQVGVFGSGNEHTALFLLAPQPEIDFVVSDESSALLPDSGSSVVSRKQITESFRASFAPLSSILERLLEAGARPFLIGTPPPRGDEDYLRKPFDKKCGWYDEFAQLIGADLKTAKLVPVRRRYKGWLVLQSLMKEYADKYRIPFIATPKEASAESGFLKPEYCHDMTHANPAYGTLMLAEIKNEMPRATTAAGGAAEAQTSERFHPYKDMPARNFWPRGFAHGAPEGLLRLDRPLVSAGEKIVTAGSCFASNIIHHLEQSGFSYLRTERRPPQLSAAEAENFGYDKFSANYGHIYTPLQMLQLLRRSRGTFKPAEDRWLSEGAVRDPFRPGLKYYATSDHEFDLITKQHLDACLRAFMLADVFIFTLGLTEAWVSKYDGAVFPACPGTIAGELDPLKHEFKNFTASEVFSDLVQFIDELRSINPEVRVILTVSPVPLVAIATDRHVLSASTYSKSVLRVAAEQVCSARTAVTYFPAYEIVTGPQAPTEFYQEERRNVSPAAIDLVMKTFLASCETGAPAVQARATSEDSVQLFSRRSAEAECEELMADR